MSAQPAPTTGPSSGPSPLIGQSIGKYRVVRLLGQGGMGAVYEAQHETINQRVAIKVLHPKLTSDQSSVQRFMHEARTTSLVHHAGLVKVHDFGQLPDGSAYMMMEYLEGESLKSRIGKQGTLDSKDALRIVRQLATSLAVAHEKGVIHRENYIISIVCFHVGHFGPQRRRNKPCTLTVPAAASLARTSLW